MNSQLPLMGRYYLLKNLRPRLLQKVAQGVLQGISLASGRVKGVFDIVLQHQIAAIF